MSNTRAGDLELATAVLALEYKVLSAAAAVSIVDKSRKSSYRSIADMLLDSVEETDLLKSIATEIGIRYYDPYSASAEFEIVPTVLAAADPAVLKKYSALPLKNKSGKIVVAVSNPNDLEMLDYLRSKYGEFYLVLAPRTSIQNKLAASTNVDLQLVASMQPVQKATPIAKQIATPSSPTQDWLDNILQRAVAEGASDIHFMFQADESLLTRFRIDGILRSQTVPPQLRPVEIVGSLVSRCPTMDAANYREPQDGTFSFPASSRSIDARVALLPQSYGPTVVVRLLDSASIRARLDDMGFSPRHLRDMRNLTERSQGTILVVGPTGSGKSTTLYALLKEINAAEKNILTVENPVEYRLPMIGQTEIRAGLGERSLTFPRALRTILRLDPDVILVGEIRDTETAEVAMQASVTGHLVFATLHTGSAVGTYKRLLNMGVPPYLVSESISLIISQRLLRRVHDCARRSPPTPEEIAVLQSIGVPAPEAVAHATGCGGCQGSGYRGRIAAVETLLPSADFKLMVANQMSALDLTKQARREGTIPIIEDGMRHVANFKTTISEVVKVLAFDESAYIVGEQDI